VTLAERASCLQGEGTRRGGAGHRGACAKTTLEYHQLPHGSSTHSLTPSSVRPVSRARAHDAEAQAIAERARKRALLLFSPRYMACYVLGALRGYYGDEKVANRDTKVWHGATENGY
jgi:hypothetical protein